MVTRLDRPSRSLEHLIDLSAGLQQRGVDLVVLDQGTGTSTAAGRMFSRSSAPSPSPGHALMSERTLEGLAAPSSAKTTIRITAA
jgi:hypothetical protein